MRFLLVLALGFAGLAGPAQAQSGDTVGDRLWLLWERMDPGACGPRGCRTYTTRLMSDRLDEAMLGLIGALDARALRDGRPIVDAAAPRVCQHQDPEVILGYDPEALPLADKPLALRGLAGVHVNLRGLKAPHGFEGDFGGGLQRDFERRFRSAGIPLISADQVEKTPGQPKLNVYFSHSKGDCQYSIFASLSQTVTLTRDPSVKIVAGTWSAMERPKEAFPDATEYDAILRVAQAFVTDWAKAHEE